MRLGDVMVFEATGNIRFKGRAASAHQPSIISRAILTSFINGDIRRVAFTLDRLRDRIGQEHIPIEAYCFSHKEVHAFIHDEEIAVECKRLGLRLDDLGTAVGTMAAIAEKQLLIELWAHRLSREFPIDRFPIVGIASFVPELAADPGSPRAVEGIGAAQLIGRLALELIALGHPVQSIEMVAGSRVHSVWWGEHQNGSKYLYASLLSNKESALRFLVNLNTAFGGIAVHLRDAGIGIGIELEPGPLFTVADKTSLRVFFQTLLELSHSDPSFKTLTELIGINLDIQHYMLAVGRRASAMDRLDQIGARAVVNCHLSGLCPFGHFADLRPLAYNQTSEFVDWLEFARTNGFGRHHVTLELEAVRGFTELVTAYREFNQVIDAWQSKLFDQGSEGKYDVQN